MLLEVGRRDCTTFIASATASSSAWRWLVSFARKENRGQIRECFENLSEVDHEETRGNESPPFAFTVWRPTKAIAIQRMMTGQATGKGLDFNSKSAKSGKLSGYVPYLHIHEERRKAKCKTLSCSARTRIFFARNVTCDHVLECLNPLQENMSNAVKARRAQNISGSIFLVKQSWAGTFDAIQNYVL